MDSFRSCAGRNQTDAVDGASLGLALIPGTEKNFEVIEMIEGNSLKRPALRLGRDESRLV